MDILVQSHASRSGADGRTLAALARRVVAATIASAEGPPDSETSVLFVDDEEMHELNRTYRNMDRPTDVLAFAAREAGNAPGPVALLGDVVVSVETAQRQAAERGHSVRRELAVLLVHGTAHLLNYDHENVGAAEARRMRRFEESVIKKLEGQLVI